MCVLQGSAAAGDAAFGGSAGRSGTVVFGAPPGALQGSWGDIHVQDSAMADVAAVLLGRADLRDLTGTGYPGSVAEQVS